MSRPRFVAGSRTFKIVSAACCAVAAGAAVGAATSPAPAAGRSAPAGHRGHQPAPAAALPARGPAIAAAKSAGAAGTAVLRAERIGRPPHGHPRHGRRHHRHHRPAHHAVTAQQIAWQMLPVLGWAPRSQFRYLHSLWEAESHWQVHAMNPYSGAYGIPQALPGSKMASAGPDWRNSATTQIRWGLRYIRAVYGSPQRAWQHEQAYGWY